MTAYTYGRGIYSDLGFRLEVEDAPLEIWSQRAADYESLPTAVAKLPLGDVALPEQEQVGELKRFLKIRVVDRNDPDAEPISALPQHLPRRDLRADGPRRGLQEPLPAHLLLQLLRPRIGLRHPGRLGRQRLRLRVPPAPQARRVRPDRVGHQGVRRRARPDRRRSAPPPPSSPCSRRTTAGAAASDGTNPRLTPNRHEPDPAGGIDSLADLPDGTPTPDLQSLPAFSIQVNRKGTQLQFAANVWNAGNSPLVVDGFRRDGQDVMDAYQYFLDEDGNQVAYQQVGTMIWHPAPSHNHWHFNDFATYELLNADMTRAVRSGKESFCLANTDAVDLTGDGAAWEAYEEDLGSVCGGYEIRSIREVLSAGWGDTYAQYRAGQSFPIKNLADGIYYVRVLANPDNTLIETDTTNNESLRKVHIYTNRHGDRKVKVAKVGLVDETNGIYGFRR